MNAIILCGIEMMLEKIAHWCNHRKLWWLVCCIFFPRWGVSILECPRACFTNDSSLTVQIQNFGLASFSNKEIVAKCCALHDNCAVLACAKICCDLIELQSGKFTIKLELEPKPQIRFVIYLQSHDLFHCLFHAFFSGYLCNNYHFCLLI